MGVTGLWKLIEASGKPVSIETLEDKIIVIDISIWLHQVVKGYQDGKGGGLHNSHLLGLFNRICKLLYFRIKPIFVFDGKVCALKFDTIAKRAQQKSKLKSESDKIEELLLQSLAKEKIIKEALGVDTQNLILSPSKKKPPIRPEKEDMFKLPDEIDLDKLLPVKSEEEEFSSSKKSYNVNISSIDLKSSYFKSLAPDIRHDILIDIKETRKQNTWGRLKELPVESQDFSSYQMAGLLKRRQVQVSLEEAEKEMGGKVFSLSELESLLAEDGILEVGSKHAQRIAGDENTRYLLVRDIAKAMSEAKERESKKEEPQPSTSKDVKQESTEDDYDLDLQKAIQMSLEDEPDEVPKTSDEPVKLNAQQRKKFVGSFQSHGLVKGFMKEYGEMNDDDIQDMIDATQVDTSISTQDKSLTQKFPHTDKYVLYGTPEKSNLSDEEKTPEKLKHPEIPVAEQQTSEKKEIVITIDSANYSQDDDIFADIFEEPSTSRKSPEKPENLDVEVASISDDDTIEYEFSDSESVPESPQKVEVETKVAENKIEDDEEDIALSESEKFWSQISQIEDEYNAKEQQSREKTPERASEKFYDAVEETESEIAERNEAVKEKEPKTVVVEASPQKEVIKEIAPEKAPKDVSNDTDFKFPKAVQNYINQQEDHAKAEKLRMELTEEELVKMKDDVQRQQKDLELERNKIDRQGTNITKTMGRECKELLRLFGIPYIDAPTEAEAQCAFLNAAKLADGIITDDSDVWLFGAKTVYKNFFLQKKVVKKFEIDDIEAKFKLDRKKLIQLAMLVGSDYTIGINGIGVVTAMEILASFPSTAEEPNGTDVYQSLLSSLRRFRDWFENGRQESSLTYKALKGKLKNIEIIPGFPNLNVMKAYLEPRIDESTEAFSWGTPDEESIFEYTKQKLGWTRLKTKEILDPVMKRFKERKQKKMEDYFAIQMKKRVLGSPKLSKRVQNAIGRMAGNENGEEEAAAVETEKKPRKRKAAKKKTVTSKEKKEIKAIQEAVSLLSEEDEPPEKKQTPEKPTTSEKYSPQKESIQKLNDEGKVNAFELLKSPTKKPATKEPKPRKRKVKTETEPKPSTSKEADSEEFLPWKKVPRIPETKQIIPQREKDKKEAEEKKQKAIEIFKNSKAQNNKKKK